uniref:Uncharacterized protein n=1 Tax=viral metagenome TaxID=1070528 RepID=A0A6C0LC97_9ZZZZ
MSLFIIVSKNAQSHDFVNALGHEIHLTRFILLDLLQKNLIDTNTFIVTLTNDRFFLYNKIFNNVINWSDYENNLLYKNEKTIDLTYYSRWDTKDNQINELIELKYNFNQFNKTEKLIEYINNINFINLNCDAKYLDIINKKFIIIHNRFKTDTNKLSLVIDKIRENNNINIVVFSMNNDNNNYGDNVIFINNLQVYASFLNHPNCSLFISEWSGGGQLAQYCYNGKILYYFDNYASHDYEIIYEELQNGANNSTNIWNAWDFKTTTNCERKYYKTYGEMLNNLIKYID